jgi:hypothetical protein
VSLEDLALNFQGTFRANVFFADSRPALALLAQAACCRIFAPEASGLAGA